MNRFTLFISFCFFTIACNTKQPVTTPLADSLQNNSLIEATDAAVSTDSAISFIRTAYQQINAATLTSKTFTWTEPNCVDEGTATYMFNGTGEIVKVIETGCIGDGCNITTYYYEKSKFIFSLETLIGGPAIGPADTTEIRKYVYNNKVVRTMEEKKYTTPEDSTLTPASKEYKILDAYQSKKFGAAFCGEY